MSELIIEIADEEGTALLGRRLAEALPSGSVVALCGTLGAGKTRLVQAIAEASGVDRRLVVSPTFVLIHEYAGRRPIYHIDAYRLRDEDEFDQLGPDEYFDGAGVVLIEWADRVTRSLPRERLELHIEVQGESQRRIELRASGPRYEAVLAALRQAYPADRLGRE